LLYSVRQKEWTKDSYLIVRDKDSGKSNSYLLSIKPSAAATSLNVRNLHPGLNEEDKYRCIEYIGYDIGDMLQKTPWHRIFYDDSDTWLNLFHLYLTSDTNLVYGVPKDRYDKVADAQYRIGTFRNTYDVGRTTRIWPAVSNFFVGMYFIADVYPGRMSSVNLYYVLPDETKVSDRGYKVDTFMRRFVRWKDSYKNRIISLR